ncbi:uncharacterized protein LOC119980048 [Tripterygium wilfordii]|uniref:uncharacterized protein LOC119980048 n=1 Tax=Tripterygium wilfordii TaxID=458696 RepID=UPI0018F837C2|nr:uncharacterized protein LOC119980048 [Tripterygium wilfordii]
MMKTLSSESRRKRDSKARRRANEANRDLCLEQHSIIMVESTDGKDSTIPQKLELKKQLQLLAKPVIADASEPTKKIDVRGRKKRAKRPRVLVVDVGRKTNMATMEIID